MKLAEYEKCCGCGNCQVVCPQNAIRVTYDQRGFLHPIVDTKKCISCGACKKKCPIINDLSELKNGFAIKGYYGKSLDLSLVKKSSSGAIASGLSKTFLLNENTSVYGSKYSQDFCSVHTQKIESVDELDKFQGSKYIQSCKGDIFNSIKNEINSGKQVLYVGLPCEIAALKLYLNSNPDNLFCVDLVCHGPTSKVVLEEYLNNISNGRKIVSFNMRYKKDGKWTPYYMHVKFEDGHIIEEPFWTSDFGAIFSRLCCDGCMSCLFKGSYRFSDLTIGDAWGANSDIIANHSSGLSSIIVNSSKGLQLLTEHEFFLLDVDVTRIIEGNPNICSDREKHVDYQIVSEYLFSKGVKKTIKSVRSLKNRIKLKMYKMLKGW